MRKFALVLVAFVALTFVATAAGHNRNIWYWTKYKAELRLLEDGVEYSDGSHSDVYDVTCLARGDSMRNRSGGSPLYRHFRCYVSTFDDVEESLLLHITGRDSFVLTRY